MPLTANGAGEISGSFTIPVGLPAGTKLVRAEGAGGTLATTTYTGHGVIETRVLQRVFTTQIWTQRAVAAVESTATTTSPTADETNNGSGGGEGGDGDPLAQTFRVRGGRHISSLDVKFCAIGDRSNPVYVQIREVSLGVPNRIVLAEAYCDMNPVVVNEWTRINFNFPVFLSDNVEYALVFLSDDNEHALRIAELGQFDANMQRWITSNPYTIGVLLSGSNTSTWTPHQRADLCFKLNACKFTANQLIVDAGGFELEDITDLVVFAGTEIPASDTSIAVLIQRDNGAGEEFRTVPGVPVRFDERLNETVRIKFELNGTDIHSPVLFPFVQLFRGEQQDEGDYVSRAVAAGADSRLVVTFECVLPGTSSVVVEVGQEGSWTTIASVESATPLGDGWVERTYVHEGYALANARVKLTLNGTPEHRPLIRGLRFLVTDEPVNITP